MANTDRFSAFKMGGQKTGFPSAFGGRGRIHPERVREVREVPVAREVIDERNFENNDINFPVFGGGGGAWGAAATTKSGMSFSELATEWQVKDMVEKMEKEQAAKKREDAEFDRVMFGRPAPIRFGTSHSLPADTYEEPVPEKTEADDGWTEVARKKRVKSKNPPLFSFSEPAPSWDYDEVPEAPMGKKPVGDW